MATFLSPNKTYGVPKEGGGSYIGIVTSVSGGVFVEIPSVAPGQSFGPCSMSGMFTLSLTYATVTTPTGTVEAVTGAQLVPGGTPSVGSNVTCVFLDNQLNEVAIIGVVG